MNLALKAILYLVLITAASVLTVKFYRAYHAYMEAASHVEEETDDDGVVKPRKPIKSPSKTRGATNAVTRTNALVSTNLPATTNQPSSPETSDATNPATQSNEPPALSSDSTNAPSASGAAPPLAPTFSTLMGYGMALFVVVICLGVLVAHDFSDFIAERFTNFVLNEEGEGLKPPEYDKAEQLVMDGHYLQAIQSMRDFLKKNPAKLYASIRIAEIYEEKLGNHLAAALEYEEVLKHRLRPEQWGWAAIHLANVYSGKLNQTDKAVALLRRIDAEYGDTAAAVKARARLAKLEGGAQQPTESTVVAKAAPIRVELPTDSAPPSNMPRGFRPKK